MLYMFYVGGDKGENKMKILDVVILLPFVVNAQSKYVYSYQTCIEQMLVSNIILSNLLRCGDVNRTNKSQSKCTIYYQRNAKSTVK